MHEIMRAFLERQREEISELAAESDRLAVRALAADDGTPWRYLIRLQCTGVLCDDGEPRPVDTDFDLAVSMAPDYLRRVLPAQVLTWLGPRSVWHPNIGPPPGGASDPIFICPGQLLPGTPLIDLVYQCWEIVTFQKVTMREDDALNRPACAWARANQRLFPVDRRPLRRPRGIAQGAR